MSVGPLFIHSLFRSSSTYFYKLLSSGDSIVCFQEALHEYVFKNKSSPTELSSRLDPSLSSKYRHPHVDYWGTLVKSWPAWVEFADPEYPIECYFSSITDRCGADFFQSIINSTRARCVFCETRTSCRIGALKNQIVDSSHVYLYRNPWDQWWSYFVDNYFFDYNLAVLDRSREDIRLYCLKDIIRANNIDIHSVRGSYILFYFFWCCGLIESLEHCAFCVNVNQLSLSVDYRKKIVDQFSSLGIHHLDFSTFSTPSRTYGTTEFSYFTELESYVYDSLSASGYSKVDIDQLRYFNESTFQVYPQPEDVPKSDLVNRPSLEESDRVFLLNSLDIIRKKSDKIASQESVIGVVTKERDSLDKDYRDCLELIKSKDSQLENVTSAKDILDEKLKSKGEQLENAISARDVLDEKLKSMDEQLDSAISARDVLDEKLKSKGEQLENAISARDVLDEKLKSMDEQLESAISARDVLDEKLKSKEDKLHSLDQKLSAKQQDLNLLLLQFDQIQKELERYFFVSSKYSLALNDYKNLNSRTIALLLKSESNFSSSVE